MGTGTKMAGELAPEHAAVIDNMKDQLIIVLVKRLGGNVKIPASEIDATSQDLLYMSLNDGVFQFTAEKKS